jgi:ribosomal protein L11 methyltransferase
LKKETYYIIDVHDPQEEQIEVLSAFLSENQFLIGITEFDSFTSFCFQEKSSAQEALELMRSIYENLDCKIRSQESENWNKVWEDNFDPVIIDKFAAIIAPHHQKVDSVKHCLIINPEMSFGTGHHETTSMMIQYLSEIPLASKRVLDFGCGTGVLAIIAEKEQASLIDAIDYDQLCIDSTKQNAQVNECRLLKVWKGDSQSINNQYDIILANVNRTALLSSSKELYNALLPKGELIISGILKSDLSIMHESFLPLLELKEVKQEGEWLAIRYYRK